MHRERQRGRVESVVHQSAGNVCRFHAVRLSAIAAIHDAFVAHAAGLPGVDDAVGSFESGSHVVGV